jgi:hypothetical protein
VQVARAKRENPNFKFSLRLSMRPLLPSDYFVAGSDDDSDFVLKTLDGGEVPVHRLILRHTSAYFNTIFAARHAKTKENKESAISVPYCLAAVKAVSKGKI